MRLNKYIAHAGIASRRKADDLIANGNVKVNGITVKEMGYDVLPDDTVEVNGSYKWSMLQSTSRWDILHLQQTTKNAKQLWSWFPT